MREAAVLSVFGSLKNFERPTSLAVEVAWN